MKDLMRKEIYLSKDNWQIGDYIQSYRGLRRIFEIYPDEGDGFKGYVTRPATLREKISFKLHRLIAPNLDGVGISITEERGKI
jgi:hypothetical protein